MAEQAMIATVHERIREREIAAQAAINRGDAFTAIAELIGAFRLLATLTKGDTDESVNDKADLGITYLTNPVCQIRNPR